MAIHPGMWVPYVLLNTAAITSVVSDRIFPVGMPQNKDLPGIVFSYTSLDPHSVIQNTVEAVRYYSVTVELYGFKYDVLKSLELDVVDALDRRIETFTISGQKIRVSGCSLVDARDDALIPLEGGDQLEYVVQLDFTFSHDRTVI